MRIGIIGLGSFGKTILKLLPKTVQVVGYDIAPENVPKGVVRGSIEEVSLCEVVILAVPIGSYDQILQMLSKSLLPTTVLVDVCSVKTVAENLKKQYLPEHASYLSVHPLFGSRSIEVPRSKKTMVVTYCGDERAQRILNKAIHTLRIEPVEATADNHDRMMAYTHALTFFLGEALRDFLPEEPTFAPPSYALLTQLRDFVADSSPQLTVTIEDNPYFDETIKSFIALLSKNKDMMA